jgi:anti-sigma factor RsiW
VTTACRELELSISLRAVGALDAAEGARLDAHLADCPACRAAAASTADVLELVRLPPPTHAEQQALADLPARAAAEARSGPPKIRAPASLRNGRRIALGAIVAAGIGAIAIVPGLFERQRPDSVVAPEATVSAPAALAESSWQEPDLDTLWQDASVVTLDEG